MHILAEKARGSGGRGRFLIPSRTEDSSAIDLPYTNPRFRAVAEIYRKWLPRSDRGLLEFILGSIAANHYDADPVWLMCVGGPGSGKTELIRALGKVDSVHEVSTITESALLSGVAKRDRTKGSTGGLLREIGSDLGFILLKDFGSLLSMNREGRGQVLAAMREVYDGAWTRRVGADGGIKLSWRGKVSFICGATGAVDLHHVAMASLGERFVYYRLKSDRADRPNQGDSALDHIGHTAGMRKELSDAIAELFDPLPELPKIQDFLIGRRREQIIALANLSSMARSAVERDNFTHDIVLVQDPESPTRMATALGLLLGGMVAIGVPEGEAWNVVRKVALDSVPPIRKAALCVLLGTAGCMDLSTIGMQARLGCSPTTLRRALEDLEAHRLLCRQHGEKSKSLWSVTEWTRQLHQKAGFEKRGMNDY